MRELIVKSMCRSLLYELMGLRVDESDIVLDDFTITGMSEVITDASFQIYDRPSVKYELNFLEDSITIINAHSPSCSVWLHSEGDC